MGKTATNIGCDKASIWKRTEGTTVTYGTAIDFSKRIISVGYEPTIAKGQLDAGDVVADTYMGKTGANLDINVINLSSADRVALFGEELDDETNVETGDDFIPYIVFAWASKRSDGKYDLFKVMKAMFEPGSEKYETVKKGDVTYNTKSIKGVADTDGDNKTIRYVYYGADVTTDATLISTWFATADYHKTV